MKPETRKAIARAVIAAAWELREELGHEERREVERMAEDSDPYVALHRLVWHVARLLGRAS